MAREITRKLHEWGHKEAVYIGGDPTSQKDDVKQEKGHDLFLLIANELKEFKPRRFLLSAAPSVRMSADFFNSILEIRSAGNSFQGG
jgi:phage terminase large subunit